MLKKIKAFFGQKKRLKEDCLEQEILIQKMSDKNYLLGVHLMEQPFIPEYAGFTEYLSKNNSEMVIGRFYNLGDVNMIKPIDSELWIISSDSLKFNITVKIDNMHQGLSLLNCHLVPGMSVKDYLIKSGVSSELFKKELSLES